MKDSEKALEARLRRAVELRGGMALKLSSQMHRGLPDRMVLMPYSLEYFVELKSKGKKPTDLQKHCHNQLRSLGFFVAIIDSDEALQNFLSVVDYEQAELGRR